MTGPLPAPLAAPMPGVEGGPPLPGLDLLKRLGHGRTGGEYLVRDVVTQRQWMLKEYLPPALARRRADGVELLAPALQTTFELGLAAFVDEATWLTRARDPTLRRVHRVWRAQGTAFALLAHEEGVTLLRHLARLPHESQVPDEEWLITFVRALAAALQVMHESGRLHRGLHPGEVIITQSGHAMLLGLGTMQLRRGDGTPVFADGLRDGFAAPEQYRDAPSRAAFRSTWRAMAGEGAPGNEGPWTDLYALAAITFGLMTGVALEPARQRGADAGAMAAARLARLPAGRFSPRLAQGIERTLALLPEQRPQSVGEFLDATGLAPRRPEADTHSLRFLFDVPRTTHAEVDLAVDLDLDLGAGRTGQAKDAGARRPRLPNTVRSASSLPAVAVVVAAPAAAGATSAAPTTPNAAPLGAGMLDPTLLDA